MTAGTLFWIIMLIVLLFGAWTYYSSPVAWGFAGINLILWVLLALLGWKVFGPAIKQG